MLYKRDYFTLTNEELTALEDVKKREKLNERGDTLPGSIHRNLFGLYPKAARHYLSLFPNNYLDQFDLNQNQVSLKNQVEEYIAFINKPNVSELDVKAWILKNEAYHIVASILSCYNFGHHSAYLFTEFPLVVCQK